LWELRGEETSYSCYQGGDWRDKRTAIAIILEAAAVITNLTGFVSGLLSLFCYVNK